MATTFIPRPQTLLGQLVININMPFSAAVWAVTMYWPSTYHDHLPSGLQYFLPWPWATVIYFAISLFVLPIVAAEWEARLARDSKRIRGARESAGSKTTPQEL
jgi:hypothetical protein